MPAIKFSHAYPKLHGQRTAILVHVEAIQRAKLDSEMVELDTFISEGNYYQLPRGTVIVLTFYGNKRIPFTTILPYGAGKICYYERQVGKTFDIVIVKPEKQEVEQTHFPLETPHHAAV
jgi:hypothetical protein